MAVAELPSLVSIPHPLVADQRSLCYAAFEPRETLRAYIERSGIVIARGPVAVWHNGYRVPDELWSGLIPRKGDQVIIRGRAEGGGGGNKVLRTVALVVIAIAAVYTGGAAAAAYGGSATVAGAAAGAAASAAVVIGGSLIVNALIPLPKPNVARTANSSVDNAPSYQIQSSRNSPRPWEPMLLVMGGPIKVVPDIASNPSTQYVGDDQYLSQIFHFGLQPDLVIDDIRVGDTPIFDFQGVQTQRSGWDGVITLAPDNVDTLQGYDLNQPDGWNSRTTPVDTNYFEIEVAAILFNLDTTTGKFNNRTVIFQIEYRNVNDSTWTPLGQYTDPVYATHYWALGVYAGVGANDDVLHYQWTQVSYGSLNPDDHTDGEQYQECQTWGGGDAGDNYSCQTFEWRWVPHPFQLGNPWQGVAPDPLISYVTSDGDRLTNDESKPIRWTYSASVPLGQYEIRVQKVSEDISSNTDSNVISVTQIRAYQFTPTDYSDQLRMAVRIKATSQLNGPIDELSATCWAQCNRWDGSAWIYGQTRNPAWWFLWFALGRRNADGNKLYGACIPEAQIDVESIKAWGAYCDAKSWTFDYVLAQKMTAHDVLTMMARAGQASYSWQSGKLGVVWDAANLPVVAMIGPYNIKAGTFEVSYVDGTVDEIIGNFINKDRDWQADQVRVRVPNAPSLNNPQTFDLEGVVDASVAGRMVNLVAASQNFHRRRVSWEMDIEGYIATRGDVVQLSHDLTVWGYAGRLTGGSHAISELILDRTVPASEAGFLSIRSPWGDMALVGIFGVAAETDTLIFDASMPGGFPLPADHPDISPLDWAWQYDPLQLPGRRLKIVSVTPTNDEGVKFEAVDDDTNYYNSETNPFAYTPPRDGTLLRGIILSLASEETVLAVASDSIQVRLDWVSTAATRYNVDYTINGQAFPTVATTDRYITISAHTADAIAATVVPITATGLGVSKSTSLTVVGLLAPLPPVTGLTSIFRDGLTVLKWDAVVDVRNPGYEVRLGSTWNDSRTVAVTSALELLAVGNGLYFVAAKFSTSKGIVIYGPADSLSISGATIVRNVLVTVQEDPDWDGTLEETTEHVEVDTPQLFGIGDGATASFQLPVSEVIGDPVIWREDWQGKRLLYATSRTNLARHSDTPFGSGWSANNVTGATGIAAPDGSSNAVTLTASSSSAYTYQNYALTNGTNYCVSVFAKARTGQPYFFIRSFQQVGGARFLLTGDGSVDSISDIASDAEITALDGGWYHCYVVFTANADGTSNISATNFVASGVSIDFFGVQTEVGDHPSSYIPAISVTVAGPDYVIDSNGEVDLAAAPVDAAVLTWTGEGNLIFPSAFVFDGQLTLAAQGDILASSDVLALDDVLWYGGVSTRGVYQTADSNIVDIGYITPVRVDFAIDAYAINFSENILAIEDILSYADILNASNQQHYTVQPQIRTAVEEGEWSDWANYVPGLLNARYFDVRLVLTTDDPLIVPFVVSFSWTVDVPDLIQSGINITVPSTGLRITYEKKFHAKPNVQIATLDAVNGDRYVMPASTQDEGGFNIQFFNGSTPVERVMNQLSQGY